MKKMRIVIFLVVILFWIGLDILLLLCGTKAEAKERDEPLYIPMEATAYCYGTTRCDGGRVRKGICAAKPEWYGKTAAVYENKDGKPGEFIGYYECLDTGGQEIKDGKVLDIYHPDYNWCVVFGRKNVLVMLIDGEG